MIIPDPRTKSPSTLFISEAEVALHWVIGILFEHDLVVEAGRDEAVLVDARRVFQRVETDIPRGR